MLKMIVSGCNGHMGQSVVNICSGMEDVEVVAGFNRTAVSRNGFPVYSDPMEYTGEADVVIDFSNPANLTALLRFAVERQVPIVLCTTGYSAAQLAEIDAAAQKVPVFKSGNMSLGINLMLHLVRRAAAVLGADFDIEIVERHHRRKVDAPSGTALMIAEAAAESLPYEPELTFERHSVRQPRGKHEIVFAGLDEVFEIKHAALSRDVFAAGAVTAARFIAGVRAPGMYDMDDALAEVMK